MLYQDTVLCASKPIDRSRVQYEYNNLRYMWVIKI